MSSHGTSHYTYVGALDVLQISEAFFSSVFIFSFLVLVVKSLLAKAGDFRDAGLIPGSGRSPGEENGNSLRYSCLENLMDREAWWARVRRVAKSWKLETTEAT